MNVWIFLTVLFYFSLNIMIVYLYKLKFICSGVLFLKVIFVPSTIQCNVDIKRFCIVHADRCDITPTCILSITYSPTTSEYKDNIGPLISAVEDHRKDLVPGQPQLNWCDDAVMVSELWFKFFSKHSIYIFLSTTVVIIFSHILVKKKHW